ASAACQELQGGLAAATRGVDSDIAWEVKSIRDLLRPVCDYATFVDQTLLDSGTWLARGGTQARVHAARELPLPVTPTLRGPHHHVSRHVQRDVFPSQERGLGLFSRKSRGCRGRSLPSVVVTSRGDTPASGPHPHVSRCVQPVPLSL